MIQNSFRQGIKDGIPIALGYLSVSFTFGMMASSQGIPLWAAGLISLTNLTSAGQFAALGIIASAGSMIEMALTQFVINLRYFLMSLSLSQKADEKMNLPQRAVVSFGITDEIFAVASSRYNGVGFQYMMALMILPILGWTAGTLLGGITSSILPSRVSDALGIMIYGMFLAIIIPPSKKSRPILWVCMIAAFLSCLLQWFSFIGQGFVIILCTLVAASLGAWLFPVNKEETHD